MTELDPDVADEAPSAEVITLYDEQNFVTYVWGHRNPHHVRNAGSSAYFHDGLSAVPRRRLLWLQFDEETRRESLVRHQIASKPSKIKSDPCLAKI